MGRSSICSRRGLICAALPASAWSASAATRASTWRSTPLKRPKPSRAKPYTLQAHYYARGPMGYGMGKLEIIDHDGQGGLTFDERTFVVMVDHAFVDLGAVNRL